jgi:hypothetical protein
MCGSPGCLAHKVIDGLIQLPGFISESELNKSQHELIVFDVSLAEAIYDKDELSPSEVAAHPGPFLARWRPL